MTRTTYPALPTGGWLRGLLPHQQPYPDAGAHRFPALQVMTDLTRLPAAIICRSALVHEAHQAMIHRGVRMLFVTNEDRQLGDHHGQRPARRTSDAGDEPLRTGSARNCASSTS